MGTGGQTLRIHAIAAHSRSNGPGLRTVIWVQGCKPDCPGCYTPAMHDRGGGCVWDVDDLAAHIAATPGIDGVTVSGGEPFEQPLGVLALLQRLRESSPLSVVVFSGYTRAEIEAQPLGWAILAMCDVLVDARVRIGQPARQGVRGLINQRVWRLSQRFEEAELGGISKAEVVHSSRGSAVGTDIEPRRRATDRTPTPTLG
jgi:anaerobic ribonucleoside-triphosphate reductase activating protein